MNIKKIIFLTHAALIAALYVVLTMIANAMGLANYAIQIRFSEALAILPFFTPAAVPGLFIGCLLSNLLTGCCLLDIFMGSIATFIGALGAHFLRNWKWLIPLPAILANTIIIPWVLTSPYGYGLSGSLWYVIFTVGMGELISCGGLGMLLYTTLQKHTHIFHLSP